MSKTKVHGSQEHNINLDEVLNAVEFDRDIGFCRSCGAENGPCEPDARNYECESCGEMEVFGAEELLMMMVY